MRLSLAAALPEPVWPAGVRPGPFDPARDAPSLHQLFEDSYRHGGGVIAPFPIWWSSLRADDEYDANLCILARDSAHEVVGAAQCWTGGYIKDLAVRQDWRRRGLGTALLLHVFQIYRARGVSDVDLKVERDNPSGAMRLYGRVGMAIVADPDRSSPDDTP